MSQIPPNPIIIKLSADLASFEAVFGGLSELLPDLADAPSEFVDCLLAAVNRGDNIVRFEAMAAAPGASELRVCAQPTDFLLRLKATIRARDFDLGIFKDCLGHDSSSVGSATSNEERAPAESQVSVGACARRTQEGAGA